MLLFSLSLGNERENSHISNKSINKDIYCKCIVLFVKLGDAEGTSEGMLCNDDAAQHQAANVSIDLAQSLESLCTAQLLHHLPVYTLKDQDLFKHHQLII